MSAVGAGRRRAPHERGEDQPPTPLKTTAGSRQRPAGGTRGLQQAQRCLSQSAFFACLDAMGGPEAALALIERTLAPPEELGAHGGVGGRGQP